MPCWTYQIHGCRIASNVPLPGAGKSVPSGCPDISFASFAATEARIDAAAADPEHCYTSPFRIRGRPRVVLCRSHRRLELRVIGCGRFVIAGKRVVLYREPGAGVEDVANVFLGSVLTLWLECRGMVALHAGAVADRAGRTVAFCGASGAGKSTLTQHLVSAGYGLVTDDVLMLSFRSEGIFCPSGSPSIRLTPASLDHFRRRVNLTAAPETARSDKFHSLARSGCLPDTRLHAIYVLDRSPRVLSARIVELAPSESLMALVKNSFIACLSEPLQPQARLARLRDIVRRVPIRRLELPDRHAALEQLPPLFAARAPQTRTRSDRDYSRITAERRRSCDAGTANTADSIGTLLTE